MKYLCTVPYVKPSRQLSNRIHSWNKAPAATSTSSLQQPAATATSADPNPKRSARAQVGADNIVADFTDREWLVLATPLLHQDHPIQWRVSLVPSDRSTRDMKELSTKFTRSDFISITAQFTIICRVSCSHPVQICTSYLRICRDIAGVEISTSKMGTICYGMLLFFYSCCRCVGVNLCQYIRRRREFHWILNQC